MKLPLRVKVKEIVKSRYQPGARPVSWNDRLDAIEQIKTDKGELLNIFSNGGQSSPAPGWELLLTRQIPSNNLSHLPDGSDSAFEWTVYGIGPSPR